MEIGRVGRPHGTRGALRVQLHNPASQLLLGARTVVVTRVSGVPEERRVRRAHLGGKGAIVVELAGVDSVALADELRGAAVSLPRSALPPVEEGEFYACDLEGCRVLLAGELIGAVVRIAFYPSCEVLVIAGTAGAELEVPLLDDFVAAVDLPARTVTLRKLDALS